MSQVQLESLYAGLVEIAALPPDELQALIESLLAEKETPRRAVGVRLRLGFAPSEPVASAIHLPHGS
jgi:hypothetical protein